MSIRELADHFKAGLSQVIDPASCSAVAWMDKAIEAQPDMTIEQFVDEIDRKIDEGTADHGWLIAGLRFGWDVLTVEQRLRYIAVLVKGGAHKPLVGMAEFRDRLEPRERAALRSALAKGKSLAAIRRLDNVR